MAASRALWRIGVATRQLSKSYPISLCHTNSTPAEGNGCSSQFDEKMLEFLACPLSKKPLRYDASTNELVSDDIGVAYPVRHGIPCLIPDDGRMLHKTESGGSSGSVEDTKA